jgi:hypothetical protein
VFHHNSSKKFSKTVAKCSYNSTAVAELKCSVEYQFFKVFSRILILQNVHTTAQQ